MNRSCHKVLPVSGLFFWVIGFMLLFSGCAVIGKPAPTTPELSEPGLCTWSAVRFRFLWASGEEPRWPLDLLMADRVAEPARRRHAADIPLWRFHRRAVRDEAGHQFSFLFYAKPEVCRQVFAEIQADPLLEELRRAGLVKEVLSQESIGEVPADIGATSDPAWTPEMQRAWPHYIMGVSALWLSLIEQIAGQEPAPGPSMEDLVGFYGRVDEKVGNIWMDEAQHALLHHLNAIFGYRPLMIRKPMRF